jgi:hypothetical protein
MVNKTSEKKNNKKMLEKCIGTQHHGNGFATLGKSLCIVHTEIIATF